MEWQGWMPCWANRRPRLFCLRLVYKQVETAPQLMPLGTPEQIRDEVQKNLSVAGSKGGLFCCPTHMLEPEVPWEKIEAYIDACTTLGAFPIH